MSPVQTDRATYRAAGYAKKGMKKSAPNIRYTNKINRVVMKQRTSAAAVRKVGFFQFLLSRLQCQIPSFQIIYHTFSASRSLGCKMKS